MFILMPILTFSNVAIGIATDAQLKKKTTHTQIASVIPLKILGDSVIAPQQNEYTNLSEFVMYLLANH